MSEVRRKKIFGNFKTPRAQREKNKQAEIIERQKEAAKKARIRAREKRAKIEGNDENHLRLIRKLCCCVPSCRVVGVDPHHLKTTGKRWMGRRSPDQYAVPLCREHHDSVERSGSKNELDWFERIAIDPLELADALWRATGSLKAMFDIVVAHKLSALRALSRRRKE